MIEWSIELLLDSLDHHEDAYAKWKLVGKYRVYESAGIVMKKLYDLKTNDHPLNKGTLTFNASRDRQNPGNPRCFWKINILWVSQKVVEDIKDLVIETLKLDKNEIIIK